jgi:hypothetical protein
MLLTHQNLLKITITGLLYVVPCTKCLVHSRVQSAQIILFLNSLLQIYHLLFQGRIKEVHDLLAQHPDRNPGGQDVSA